MFDDAFMSTLCRQNTFFNNVHNDKILLLMAVDQKFNRFCYNWKS